MIIFKKKADLKKYIASQNGEVGFVPTMGALHQGHLSLIEASVKRCDVTVCSIFVNPTQFNDPRDLEKYPRPIANDIELLTGASCDILYLPDYKDLYETDELLEMDMGGLDLPWEGEVRPGHFKGMVTVVKKLFEAVLPQHVFFGQKDFQQCCIVRKLIHNFNIPVTFHQCPIIREEDGLAMSSRNIRLSPEERARAIHIHKVLVEAAIKSAVLGPRELEQWTKEELERNSLEVEYAGIADAFTLEPADTNTAEKVLLVAVKLPSTRLIDNILLI